MDWNTFLTTVGSGAVVLGATAWLIKTIITAWLDRKATEFERALETTAATEIERLRNALQIAAEEHRVRYSNLHEKRAQRIEDLYERIVNFSVLGQQFYARHASVAHRAEAVEDLRAEFQKLDDQFFELSRFF